LIGTGCTGVQLVYRHKAMMALYIIAAPLQLPRSPPEAWKPEEIEVIVGRQSSGPLRAPTRQGHIMNNYRPHTEGNAVASWRSSVSNAQKVLGATGSGWKQFQRFSVSGRLGSPWKWTISPDWKKAFSRSSVNWVPWVPTAEDSHLGLKTAVHYR
jgi:hypothetical protein